VRSRASSSGSFRRRRGRSSDRRSGTARRRNREGRLPATRTARRIHDRRTRTCRSPPGRWGGSRRTRADTAGRRTHSPNKRRNLAGSCRCSRCTLDRRARRRRSLAARTRSRWSSSVPFHRSSRRTRSRRKHSWGQCRVHTRRFRRSTRRDTSSRRSSGYRRCPRHPIPADRLRMVYVRSRRAPRASRPPRVGEQAKNRS
jgi:hypothetical protein